MLRRIFDWMALWVGRLVLVVVGFGTFWVGLARVLGGRVNFRLPGFLNRASLKPLRTAAQPPVEVVERMRLEPGAVVLEVCPVDGQYTIEAARWIAPDGTLAVVAPDATLIESIRAQARRFHAENIDARRGSPYDLPLPADSVDAAFMLSSPESLSDPVQALVEIRRVLRPGGRLALHMFALDPGYLPWADAASQAERAGFRLIERIQANPFWYTLILTC